ncbi:MAG TPA: zinc-binding alcohol dehydrogenase [Streptosporangiaceae bacterium]|nr:zinc-binding alcohol dehydrogenase [Streptosporangiaceae bacterium]
MSRTEHGAGVAHGLWFSAARQAEMREEALREPANSDVLVRAIVSLVSAGTELRVYRGEVSGQDDLGLETAEGTFEFPVKYAYQVVGEVIQAADGARFKPGDIVFARHPHQDYFTIRSDNRLLSAVPAGLTPERAVFVNLLEVALNSQLDVPVRHGDCVVVYGQGIVGSLCAQLASRTAGTVIVVDPLAVRRQQALAGGATAAFSPDEAAAGIEDLTNGRGADISVEASGAPSALQAAITATGQEGTIVAISYFGMRAVTLTLAPEFHFRRQRIVSSQTSSLGSGLQPRWSLDRRIGVAFNLLQADWLRTPVSHRLPFANAAEAYRILDTTPELAAGILLAYSDGKDIDGVAK